MAEMYSVLIRNLIEMDEAALKSFTASGILKLAEERLIESDYRVRARVEEATIDAQNEELHHADSEKQS